MIESFHISNFKVIHDLELPRLTPITLLAGKNNVGKTTVLEALFAFCARINPQVLLQQYGWRGIPNLPVDPEAVWSPTFNEFDIKRGITLSAKVAGHRESLTITVNPASSQVTIPANPAGNGVATPTITTDQPASPTVTLDMRFKAEQKPDQEASIVLGAGGLQWHVGYMEGGGYPAAIINLRNHENPNEIAARYGQLDVYGKQEAVLEFLRLIDSRLKSLTTITTGNLSMIYGDIGLPRKVPISYMGDGIVRLLSIITFIATNANGVVLIDEVESGLHYSVMPSIWRAIAGAALQFNCQVIGTTHSYECLQAAKEGLADVGERDFTFIRLDQKNGKSRAKTFDFNLFVTSLDADLEIR